MFDLFNQKAAPVSVGIDVINDTFGAGRKRSVRDDDFSGYVLLCVGINRLFNSLSAKTFCFLQNDAKAATDPDDENAHKYPTSSGMFMTVHSPRPGRLGLAFVLRNPVPDRSATYYKTHMILGLDGHLIGTREAPTRYEIRRIIWPLFSTNGVVMTQQDIPVTPKNTTQTMAYAKSCINQMTGNEPLTPAQNLSRAVISTAKP